MVYVIIATTLVCVIGLLHILLFGRIHPSSSFPFILPCPFPTYFLFLFFLFLQVVHLLLQTYGAGEVTELLAMEGEGMMETAVQVRVVAATEGLGEGAVERLHHCGPLVVVVVAVTQWGGGGGGGGIAPAAPGWSAGGGGGGDASSRAGAVVSAGKEFKQG